MGFTSFRDFADAHAARIDRLIGQSQGEPTRPMKVRRGFLTNDEACTLAKITCDFLATDYFCEALRLEWTDVQLFGICANAPLVRVDCWGLITGLPLYSALSARQPRPLSWGEIPQHRCDWRDDHHTGRLAHSVRPLSPRLGPRVSVVGTAKGFQA
jgi:hypothetical protein